MTKAERAKEWFRFAQDDLRSAEVLFKEEIFNEVCFHAQQCAEKGIKAFLIMHDQIVPKTHRLVDLFEEAIKHDPRLEPIRKGCIILDQYYIPTRYPDAVIGSRPSGLPSRQDAEESLHIAESIFQRIQSDLKSG